MNLPLRIARRYLFAKKSTNAINIITGIAVFGVAVGTAALVLVLMVFNGFEDLFVGLYNDFNPDVRITAAKGKTFVADDSLLAKLDAVEGIEARSLTLEDVAFFQYKDKQDFGILKGVDEQFVFVSNIDSTIREGEFQLGRGEVNMGVISLIMANGLSLNLTDEPVSVFMPKRKKVRGLEKPFKRGTLQPVGVFLIQQNTENQMVLSNLQFVQDLLGYEEDVVSSLELKLYKGFDQDGTYDEIRAALGPDYVVENRFEQEASFLRLMQIEKWLSFAIAGLMMLLISFNLIGALWMVVLEKEKDIAILKSMGTRDASVRLIFLYQGVLLCTIGVAIGFLFALLVFGAQKNMGLISLPGGYFLEAYPVSSRWWDFPIVAVTVLSIGLLASILPARHAGRVSAILREE